MSQGNKYGPNKDKDRNAFQGKGDFFRLMNEKNDHKNPKYREPIEENKIHIENRQIIQNSIRHRIAGPDHCIIIGGSIDKQADD